MKAGNTYYEVSEAVGRAGSQRAAAKALGMGRTTVANILKRGPGRCTRNAACKTPQPNEIAVTPEVVAAFEAVKSGELGLCAAAKSIDMVQSTFSRKYARWNGGVNATVPTAPLPPQAVKSRTKTQPATRGITGFKALFSPSQRGHDAIAKLTEGELKTRGWIYDSEMRVLAGVDSVSWTNLRRDYEHLLVEVRDPETRARKTVWCHPDIVEEARQVAKERAR